MKSSAWDRVAIGGTFRTAWGPAAARGGEGGGKGSGTLGGKEDLGVGSGEKKPLTHQIKYAIPPGGPT